MKYLLLISLIFICQNVSSQTYGLTVTITNIKVLRGDIRIGIYNTKNSFPHNGEEYKRYSLKVTQSLERYTFTNLPKGEYAIALYHDENDDGVCNINFLGIPKEGYGFSNNYKPKLFIPDFNDCKFFIMDNKSISIALNK